MNIKIYTLTHKKFDVPPDPMYVPLQVGSAVHEDLGYLRDDDGENISSQNCYYSELTGFYWIWKNDHTSDYVGTCHYRRYLINEQEKVLTKQEYESLLTHYDLVTTKMERLDNSYYEGFAANHNIQALEATGEVIREKYPGYYDIFERMVHGPKTYYCNMLVTSKQLFDSYAEWLFGIFFEVQRRIDPDNGEDAYHKRVFGFISEFLLTVWVSVQKLKVCECKVGVIGEKVETREMKERLIQYLREKDTAGAKAYFLKQHQLRPDLMMEAADTAGELRLAMQMIATADEQLRRSGHSFLEKECEFAELVPLFARLNEIVSAQAHGRQTAEDMRKLQEILDVVGDFARTADAFDQARSDTALQIAAAILPDLHADQEK